MLPRFGALSSLGALRRCQRSFISFSAVPYKPRCNMSSVPVERTKPFAKGAALRGTSGRNYHIEGTLTERRDPLLCVYKATAEGQPFIVKNMIPGEFEYQQDLQKSLASCPNVRAAVDFVPEFELFIYRYLVGDLLRLRKKALSKDGRRSILRDALTGLAEMHDRNIMHTDIKPNNILLDYEETADGIITVGAVQISDLEDSVILPPGKHLIGPLCGNQLWRSPESWARAKQNQSSDIFSFGVVSIYVMLDDMIFLIGEKELRSEDAWRHILAKHISYFADEDGFKGLLQHIGQDNLFFDRLIDLAADFSKSGKLRQPFAVWEYVDVELRDLITKMTNLDPTKRITAREALEHPWFRRED